MSPEGALNKAAKKEHPPKLSHKQAVHLVSEYIKDNQLLARVDHAHQQVRDALAQSKKLSRFGGNNPFAREEKRLLHLKQALFELSEGKIPRNNFFDIGSVLFGNNSLRNQKKREAASKEVGKRAWKYHETGSRVTAESVNSMMGRIHSLIEDSIKGDHWSVEAKWTNLFGHLGTWKENDDLEEGKVSSKKQKKGPEIKSPIYEPVDWDSYPFGEPKTKRQPEPPTQQPRGVIDLEFPKGLDADPRKKSFYERLDGHNFPESYEEAEKAAVKAVKDYQKDLIELEDLEMVLAEYFVAFYAKQNQDDPQAEIDVDVIYNQVARVIREATQPGASLSVDTTDAVEDQPKTPQRPPQQRGYEVQAEQKRAKRNQVIDITPPSVEQLATAEKERLMQATYDEMMDRPLVKNTEQAKNIADTKFNDYIEGTISLEDFRDSVLDYLRSYYEKRKGGVEDNFPALYNKLLVYLRDAKEMRKERLATIAQQQNKTAASRPYVPPRRFTGAPQKPRKKWGWKALWGSLAVLGLGGAGAMSVPQVRETVFDAVSSATTNSEAPRRPRTESARRLTDIERLEQELQQIPEDQRPLRGNIGDFQEEDEESGQTRREESRQSQRSQPYLGELTGEQAAAANMSDEDLIRRSRVLQGLPADEYEAGQGGPEQTDSRP